ncbi:uncharacterized protein [Nicotiana sylvestris]|uniref:uncharacterized protein n=1 Tax=Nicotiana sylvestris TaxID=4096 RepID=UPI00388CB2B4
MTFYFTVVYGLHTVQDGKELWRNLRDIERIQQEPWLVMGDFNVILEVEDRVHGNVVQDHEIRDFREFVEDAGMTKLKAIGRSFTWTNSNVFSKIDRALVNGEWMNKMPHIQVHVLDSYFSDHSHLCVELERQQKATTRPFRFMNCLADDPNFGKIVTDNWQINTNAVYMKNVWFKLKQTSNERPECEGVF